MKKTKLKNPSKESYKEKVYSFLFIFIFLLLLLMLIIPYADNDFIIILLILGYFIIILIGLYLIFKKNRIIKIKDKSKLKKDMKYGIIGALIGISFLPIIFYYNPYIADNIWKSLLIVLIFTSIPSFIGYIIGLKTRK